MRDGDEFAVRDDDYSAGDDDEFAVRDDDDLDDEYLDRDDDDLAVRYDDPATKEPLSDGHVTVFGGEATMADDGDDMSGDECTRSRSSASASTGIHTDAEDDDGASSSSSSDDESENDNSDTVSVDPRLTAGVGLSKRELLRKKVDEENRKQYFATEEVREAVYRRKAAHAAVAAAKFETLMQNVEKGLGDDGVVAMSDDLVYARELELSKKLTQIHKEWEETIFNKLQSQIKKHVDGVDCETLSSRLRADATAYENAVTRKQAVNKNAGVFLDSVIGHDYDPYASRRKPGSGPFTAVVDSLRDPSKRDIYKPIKEQIAAGRIKDATAALAKVVPRDTLAIKFWHNLEYTPYGRYTDKDGEQLPASASIKGFFRQGQDMWNKHSAANVRDEYTYPVGEEGIRVANDEYFAAQRGGARTKRTEFNAAPGDVDGGRDPTEVIFQTATHTAGFPLNKTGGDAWLTTKTKGLVENGAVDANRPDLFGVMQFRGPGDPRGRGDKTDLNPRGDAWYAMKGLACFEQLAVTKSNRKGLYQVMQGGGVYADSGNPGGQNVGDAWLDTKLKNPVLAVDGQKWGSRYSGDAQGDLYGQLAHTHTLSEHPTKREVNDFDPVYDRMQRLNTASETLDEARHSRRHVQQYVPQI